MENLRLLGKNCLVKLDEENNTTSSGIILKTSVNNYCFGTVKYVSHDTYASNGVVMYHDIKADDRVMLFKAHGFEMTFNDEKLLLIEVDKIVGKIS